MMGTMTRLTFAVLVVTCLTSPVLAAEVDVVADVVYGHKDGMALTFDVLKPRTGANGAGILYMVSGGWVSRWSPSDRSVERFESLLDRGFTIFVVRHGSSPKYFIPEIVADVRRATRYIRFHAGSWGVDANRLGAYGGSAGGHLALMLGNASDEGVVEADEPFMKTSSRIASVVAYFPPVDLRTWARGAIPVQEGQRFPALNFERELAPDYSPIVFVTPDDPPTLLVHGDADELVPISHSERLHAAFREAGVTSEFITIVGGTHGFRGEHAERADGAMAEWFERTLAAN